MTQSVEERIRDAGEDLASKGRATPSFDAVIGRPSPRPVHRALITVVSFAIFLGAAFFAWRAFAPGPATSPGGDVNVYVAVDPHTPNMVMTAFSRSPLVVRDGCVLVGSDQDLRLPIWPKGFTAGMDESGRVEVLDDRGHVVAIQGQPFDMGGGYVAEFRPAGKVDPKDQQIATVESGLGYQLPAACLSGIYGIWQVGETTPIDEASQQAAPTLSSLSDELVTTAWTLKSIDGRPWPTHGMHRVSLAFGTLHRGSLGGYNGCNEYGAHWAISAPDLMLNEPHVLHVTRYGQTLRSCGAKSGWIEKRFTKALESDPTATLEKNELRLTSQDGVLIFSPA